MKMAFFFVPNRLSGVSSWEARVPQKDECLLWNLDARVVHPKPTRGP